MTDCRGITLACCGLLGTLVTEDGLIERSFAEAIATQGVVSGTSAFARRMAQVHQARGQAPGDVMRLLFPENEARAQAAQLAFDRALPDAIGRTVIRPLPGAVQVLDQLRAAGCRICVATSLARRVLDLVLDAAGLRHRVDLTLAAEDAPRGFPAPDLVLTAIMRTGAGAVQDVAVVHGTGAGVEAGRRSGASVVAGVLTGPHPPARLRAAGATSILASIADLPALLSDGAATAGPAAEARAGKRQGAAEARAWRTNRAHTGWDRPSAGAPGAPQLRSVDNLDLTCSGAARAGPLLSSGPDAGIAHRELAQVNRTIPAERAGRYGKSYSGSRAGAVSPHGPCVEVRQALGVYVVGAIGPAERAVVDRHLADCADCRTELVELAGLPALLRRVPVMEASALAGDDAGLGSQAAMPSGPMLPSLLPQAGRRQRHDLRTRVCASAAAGLLVGAGLIAGLRAAEPSAPRPVASTLTWDTTARTVSPQTQASAMVRYAATSWGLALKARIAGIPVGTMCELQVIGPHGHAVTAGSWTIVSGRSNWYPASSSVPLSEVHGFVFSAGSKILVTVPTRPNAGVGINPSVGRPR